MKKYTKGQRYIRFIGKGGSILKMYDVLEDMRQKGDSDWCGVDRGKIKGENLIYTYIHTNPPNLTYRDPR